MREIKRIHILGASGSGTTTLAAKLSEIMDFKHLDTDNYYWKETIPKYEKSRPIKERIELLTYEFKKFDRWILSGSLCGWGDVLTPHFDLVVFLNLPSEIRMKRLVQREKDRYGDKIEKGQPMYKKHIEFIKWASKYDDGDENIRSLHLHNKWLESINCDVLRIEEDISLYAKVKRVMAYINDLELSYNNIYEI